MRLYICKKEKKIIQRIKANKKYYLSDKFFIPSSSVLHATEECVESLLLKLIEKIKEKG